MNFKVSKSEFNKYEKLGKDLIKLHLFKKGLKANEIKLDFRKDASKENPSFLLERLNKKARFVDN